MRAGRLLLLGTAAAIALGGTAKAAPPGAWYFGVEAGATRVQGQTITEKFQAPPFFSGSYPFDVGYEGGWAVLGTVGYDWGSLRLEAEAGHRGNDIKDLPQCHGCWAAPSLKDLTLMANVLYDIPLAPHLALSLGAGIGADHARFSTGDIYFTDEQWFFAYQAIGGFSYEISSLADIVLDYRYLRVSEPTFSDADSFRAVTNKYDDLEKHTLTVGMRFWLQPRPPS